MKLLGRAIGILTDANTGEKTVAFDETNHIQDRLLLARSAYWDGGSPIGGSIMINWDSNPVTQHRDWVYQPEVNRLSGTNISGITSPSYTWNEPIDSVHVKEIAQRFEAPVDASRNIYVIGLFSNSYFMDTAVTLTVPCVQTTSQTLDVFYRVQVAFDESYWDTDWSPDSIVPTPAELEQWARWLIGTGNIPISGTEQGANWADKMNPRRLKSTVGIQSNSIILTSSSIVGNGSDYYRAGLSWTLPIANSIGKFIGVNYYRSPTNTYTPMHAQHILKDTANPTPIQNIFGHSSSALVPFYDAGTTQGGLGTMVIDGSSWTNPDFPKQMRINVNNTGALGVGTYQFQMRNILGFDENTYVNKAQECMGYTFDNEHYTDGFRIIRGNNSQIVTTDEIRKVATVEKYDEQTIMAAWIDEVMVSNVTTQEGTRFAADTTPAMSLTNVSQVAKNEDTGDVYVADRTNGAYKISADLTTVTRFYTVTTGLGGVTGCYGINVTAAGRVWAFFGSAGTADGLYYSDNDGTSWTKATFSHTAIDADPTVVTQLIVDPSHADDQLAIVYADSLVVPRRDLLIAWWDLAGIVAVGGVAVQGPILKQVADYEGATHANQQAPDRIWSDYGSPITYMKALRCSPNDGFWCTSQRILTYTSSYGYFAKFTFGTATVTNIGSTDLYGNNNQNGGWGVDENGDDAFFYMTLPAFDGGNNFVANARCQVMVSSDMTYELHTYHDYNLGIEFSKDAIVYLGGGVHLCYIRPEWNSGLPTTAEDSGSVGIVTALPGVATQSTDVTGAVFENELNPVYGWNGSGWVKGHAGSKAMHAAAEELIDGITIAFDDASGVNDWQDTDFYTFIVYNGLVADGSTTYEQDTEVYVKPAVYDTSFEASLLPATTRVPGALKEFIPASIADWQDAVGVTVSSDYIRPTTNELSYGLWTKKARSLAPAIVGSSSNLSSVTRFPNIDITGVQGYVEWNFYASSNISLHPYQHACGLSNASHLGGSLTGNTMMYSVHMDSGPTANGGLVDFIVKEAGVTKATLSGVTVYSNTISRVRMILKTDGSMIYDVLDGFLGWRQLYHSPPATVTIEDLYLEYAGSSYDGGLKFIRHNYYVPEDYFIFVGNGVDTGLFGSTFRLLDPEKTELVINGTAATQVGVSDSDTVLPAGQYSVFPEHGCIRYSASDVGNTISGNYIYVSDEI